jgi:hypothetical protein
VRSIVGWLALLALLALPTLSTGASATTLSFDLDFEFSGAQEPAGPSPWVNLTFDDSINPSNTVRLTISNVGITAAEFVAAVYVNFNPALDIGQLGVSPVDVSASSPSVSTGADAFKADGDGFFDILFDFPPPPGSAAAKFTAGESVVFDLTYPAAISVSDFDFDSAPGGGNGSYRAAAHVLGIAGGGSGWVGNGAVPEPATGILLGLAGLGLLVSRRR